MFAKFRRTEVRVEAMQVNSLEDAVFVGRKFESDSVILEKSLRRLDTGTEGYKLAGPGRRMKEDVNSYSIFANQGDWVVATEKPTGWFEDTKVYLEVFRDEAFHRRYEELPPEQPKSLTEELNPISVVWDGLKSDFIAKWLGDDFVGFTNQNVSGPYPDEIVLQVSSLGVVIDVHKDGVLTRASDGKVYVLQMQGEPEVTS